MPSENGNYVLYTVTGNHAVQHSVQIGLQQDSLVQVIADDLKPGDSVVITGNYLLKDGMEVVPQSATTKPSTNANGPQAEAKS